MSLILRNARRTLKQKGLSGLLKRWIYVGTEIPKAIARIRRLPASCPTSDLIDFVMQQSGQLILAQQVRSEIQRFLEIEKELQPRRLLEIGTSRGGTLLLLCRHAHPNAHIVSLDLPGGASGSGYAFYRIPLYKSFALPSQRLDLVRADSHQPASRDKIRGILSDHSLDLLLIDGDHSYEGVKQDFEMYSGLVRPGGIIALHDIAPHAPGSSVGVSRFWGEVKQGRNYEEIIADRNQGWGGIGVIRP